MAESSQKTSVKKKKRGSGFQSYFLDKIKPKLQGLETKRKQYLTGIAIMDAIILLIAIVTIIIGKNTLSLDIALFAFMGAVAFVGSKTYKNEVKEKILPLILTYIGDFKIGDKKFDKSELKGFFRKSNLFPTFDEMSLDDFIQGKYKNIDLNIYEILLSRIVSESEKGKVYSTVFDGICFRFKTYKKQETQTVVLKRSDKPIFGNLQRVKLEDPEFENYFDVYSGNQIASRTILTPAYMNRLVELVENNSEIALNLSMSFTDDDICMSIKSEKDWFEVSILKPVDDFSNYSEILKDLTDILSIIDTLKYTDD